MPIINKKRKNDLSRFVIAQQKSFHKALKEVENGRKKSHWMWFIFPQLRGLGYSVESNFFGIENLKEAKKYYKNQYLRNNLLTITRAFLKLDCDPYYVFYDDVSKFHSCMTLFYLATNRVIFKKIIDLYYDGKLCQYTIKICGLNDN